MDDVTASWAAAVSDWWEGIGAFQVPLRIAAIIIVAVLVRIVLQFAINRTVRGIVTGVKRKSGVEDTQAIHASPLAAVRTVQRTRTLGGVLSSALTTVVLLVTIVIIMTVLAPSAAGALSLITAALGAGLGFGAQNIVKDVLNGIFMVIEDQLGVGDVVDLGPATGVVEAVGIRITDIRDVNGTLWHVRNGEILRVGNLSQGWARAIIDLAVPYDTDIDEVQALILSTAMELANEAKWKRVIIEKPEVWGIESISSEAVVVRLVVKTRTSSKDDVARELRARLKRALDAAGIQLPALNSIVLTGFDGAASVRGARPPKTAQLPLVEQAEHAQQKTRKTPRRPKGDS
ncbi:mechanosensitive ion channel family protein [Homoserinibacter sp. GY 40078]|uniref:mechanosensitive ion channel family protein n=1 Tax=Homoserinibacter sp. GY 40078 TaxID=2603275 RepID=UPI0011C85BC1|nr:mechanosensitive ion channel domain-containing protein [Homoserinibacter sp. GY 40078]TXK19655.1 mechanosensitive ion channel [Homoserinibacter sp. GY 40078]